MSLKLTRVDDPRDSLTKARKRELVAFAQANGVPRDEVNDEMPAILIRRRLRDRGLTRIDVPHRPLGQIGQTRIGGEENGGAPPALAPEAQGGEIDAEDDLERQYAAQNTKPLTDGEKKRNSPLAQRHQLMKLCKDAGLPVTRRDTIDSLRGKLQEAGIG